VHDFGYSILPRMVHQEKVFAYEFSGYWQDIGTIDAYYRTNMELLKGSPRIRLDSRWPVYSHRQLMDLPRRGRNSRIFNSILSPGCIIDGQVDNSIISPGVRIAEDTFVRNSIIMSETAIGNNCTVESSIIDEGVQIGHGCRIGVANRSAYEEAITVIGKDVIIPSFTALEQQCKIPPMTGQQGYAGLLAATADGRRS